MNILVLNYEYPPLGGGAAPVSRDMSQNLQKIGHNVTVVTMGFQDLPEYEENEGLRIYRLKCWRSKKSACMPWEQYTYLLAVKKFMKTHMKDNSYDICHTHFIIPTGEAARLVKKKYGIPYIITAHGSDVEGYNSKLLMRVMHVFLRLGWRRIVDNSDGIVSPSRFLLSLLENSYADGNYTIIPNGIEWDKYHALAAKGKKEKRILIMGRFQKYKNVQTILRALNECKLDGWHVDVLGDGPYRQELEELCRNLGLTDKVTFHGWIDNKSEEQLDYVKKASIYITASHFENCPMAVIETIVGGCYPLLSDIPGHRQIIDYDECFFEMDNYRQLADKLSAVMTKLPGESLEAFDMKRFDWENVMQQYEALFKQMKRR